MWAQQKQRGFTIVELLIVIVVIAILATISIVAYTGIQTRAKDAIRMQDIAAIKKALQAYNIKYGGVSGTGSYVGSYSYGGWDSSTSPNWLAFLRPDHGAMPVDPVNERTTSDAPEAANRNYYYYCYNQGSGPAPATPNVVLGYRTEDGMTKNHHLVVDSCL